MPKKKSKADLTPNQVKLGFWAHLLKTGYIPMAVTNCLRRKDVSEGRVRYDFRDDKVLRFQRRKTLTPAEIETLKKGGSVSKWEVVAEAPYEKVTIGEDGGLVLPTVRKESD